MLPSLESLRETINGLHAAAEASGAKLTGGQVKGKGKAAEATARRAGTRQGPAPPRCRCSAPSQPVTCRHAELPFLAILTAAAIQQGGPK